MLLRFPIKVSGTGANGLPFEEETFTVVIGGYGAQIALHNTPCLGEQLTITNLRNGKASPFRLVRRMGRSSTTEDEWGVECLRPEGQFWGIHFPVRAAPCPPAEGEMIEALLQCHQCGTQEMARLTWGEYKTLGQRLFLRRECEQCVAPTDWGFTYLDAEEIPPETVSPSPPAPAGEGKERRRAPRRTLRVPVRIRLADGRVVDAVTENLAKVGLCLIAAAKIELGEVVGVIFGYSEPDSAVEVCGRVVRGHMLVGTDRAVYGVRLQERSSVG